MLSKSFINAAYNTRGNELCKFTRAEVMEYLEENDLTTKVTEEEYNRVVKETMKLVQSIVPTAVETAYYSKK